MTHHVARMRRFVMALSTTASISAMAVLRPVSAQELGVDVVRTSMSQTPSVVAALLDHQISVRLDRVPLRDALDTIATKGALQLSYSREQVPANDLVSLVAARITVGDALRVALEGTNLQAVPLSGHRVALGPRGSGPPLSVHTQPGASSIVGRVTEVKTGQPIGAVALTLAGTSFGATTGLDGRYRITGVTAGTYRISARRLGYAVLTRQVAVTDTAVVTVDFTLSATAAVLEQVVTTVTGNEARYHVGNLIETLQADSVVHAAPVTNLGDILNARVPGVQVFLNGGFTSASPTINIRGQNSLTVSNQPLLYIDGARADNSSASLCFGAGNNTVCGIAFGSAPLGGRLDDIAPEEIESIEVVKGPSAATLYGSDAANGVILVTTKRGSLGVPRWDLAIERGALDVAGANRLPYTYYAWGHTTDGTRSPVQCTLLLKAAGSCAIDSVTHFSPLRDPATTIIHTGYREQYSAQVSGGGGQTRYFASGSYGNEVAPVALPARDRAILLEERGATGLEPDNVRPDAAVKGSGRVNVTTVLGSTADLALSSGFLTQNNRMQSRWTWLDGEDGAGYRDQFDGWAFGERPANDYSLRNRESVTHFTGSVAPTWHPNSWLSAHATVGADYSSDYVDQLDRPNEYYVGDPGNRINGRVNSALYTADLGATAAISILPGFSAKTSVGAQYNHRAELDNGASATNLAPGTLSVAGGAVPLVTESNIETIVAGAYAEETFGVRDRLFLTGGARLDGGSAFGRAFGTVVYPKASVSWLLSDEPWMPRLPSISSLRLRAAYGASGVEPGATDALATIALRPTVTPNGLTTGGVLATIGNTDLRPERQAEFEAGLDVDALARRVHLEATYYHKQSTDALVNVPTATQLGIGASLQEINVGAVRNVGYEVTASAQVIQTRALTWTVSVNGSNNQNRLVKLAPGLSNLGLYGLSVFVVGRPLYAVFDNPILRYGDANGDGVIEPNEVTVGPTPTYHGSRFPTSQLTVYNTVGVARDAIQVSVQVDARSGTVAHDLPASFQAFFDNARAQNDPNTSLREQAAAIALTRSPILSFAGYDENGSFTRLREVSVTYNAPQGIPRLLRMRSASVTLAGRNLALWTPYRGVDPEINSAPVSLGASTPYNNEGGPPPSRYWIARVRVGL